jgi:hypothetical protein
MSPHDSPRRSLISRAVHKVRKKLPALYIDVPSSLMPSFARSKKTPVFRQQSPRFRPLPGDLWCGSARKEGGGHPEASHSADPHLVSACTDHAAHRVQAPPRSSWPPAQQAVCRHRCQASGPRRPHSPRACRSPSSPTPRLLKAKMRRFPNQRVRVRRLPPSCPSV